MNPPVRTELFATTLIALVVASGQSGAWESAPGLNTHHRLFDDAASSLQVNQASVAASAYPDLTKFEATLREAAGTENGHSDPLEISPQNYWYGTDEQWDLRARKEYQDFDFAAAYTHWGYELHMIQDWCVPAHRKFVYHGPIPETYRRAPGPLAFILMSNPFAPNVH
ncbi:MAG TPA: hypothetical protein VNI35_02120, partial [Nitrospira sp.]|nr:hypothetical protein [Nitrospira sp.]